MRTPAELYRPSERKLPALVIPAYPKDWYPHTVDSTGKIIHRRWSVYLSKVLSRYVVAVEERATECRVWFCNLLVGRYVYRVDKKASPVPQEVTVPALTSPPAPINAASDEKGDPVAIAAAC